MTGTEGQDWANYQVAAPSLAGLGFVFVKATEGSSYVNPKHDAQVAHVRAGGQVTGHYHFQHPGSPTAQAAFFLKHARPLSGDVLACDWEDTGVSCADKDQFIRAVKAAQPHLRVVLYCNRDFWLHRDTTSFVGDGLWIADPSAPKGQPRVSAEWLFHQYGSPGGIDRNYCPLTADQLRSWAAGTTPITPQQEDDVSALDVLSYRNAKADAASVKAGHGHIPDFYGYVVQTNAEVKAMHATIAALVPLVGKNVDTPTVVAAVQKAIADAVVHVSVDVTGDEGGA